MSKTSVAEWLLACLSTPERASAIVGDLLEEDLSPMSFWWSVCRIVAAMSWRWMLGFALAALSPYPLFVALGIAWNGNHPARLEPWAPLAMLLGGLTIALGTTSALVVCRYGYRNRLSMTSVGIWLVSTAGAVLAWTTQAPRMIGLLLLAVVAVLLFYKASRSATVCVLLCGSTFAVTSSVFVALALPLKILHATPNSAASVAWGISSWLASLTAEAIVLSRLRSVSPAIRN